MFSLFKRNKNKAKINVYSLTLPSFGWKAVDERSTIVVYVNDTETASVSVNYFEKKPDLPTVKDLNFLRKYYRELIAPNGGGLIETSLVTIQGITAAKTIFKIKQHTGMAYVASVTIPFENFSFVVKFQAIEAGTTGIRDAVVANELLGKGEINIGENGFENWFSDPYDAFVTGDVLMNKSEQELYDTNFPEHPLTIVRQGINNVILNTVFDAVVLEQPAFNL